MWSESFLSQGLDLAHSSCRQSQGVSMSSETMSWALATSCSILSLSAYFQFRHCRNTALPAVRHTPPTPLRPDGPDGQEPFQTKLAQRSSKSVSPCRVWLWCGFGFFTALPRICSSWGRLSLKSKTHIHSPTQTTIYLPSPSMGASKPTKQCLQCIPASKRMQTANVESYVMEWPGDALIPEALNAA